jgi:gliding motility-associated-like protein
MPVIDFKNIINLALLFWGMAAFAQVPQIQKVELINTYPGNRILISGSGFTNAAAQLQVWFGPVKGTIATSSDYAIEVDVPAQAKMTEVEVINLSSHLSAKSRLKFMPSFGGEPFDGTKFTAPLSFTSTQELWDLFTCDLNNDSKSDIISTKFSSPATDLMILQNTSTPGGLAFTKLDKTNLPVLDLTFPIDNVVCSDLQGDGKPDLVLTRSGSPRNSIHILTNTSSATISFATPITLNLDVGHLATRVSVKDLNEDGKPDIVVTNSFDNTLYIFQNQSTGGVLSFNATPIKITVTGATNTYSVDVQDLDNDGLPDIILTQFQTNDIFLLKNKSAGAINFPIVQKISVAGTLNRITTSDLNNDNLLDLIVTNTLGNQIIVLLNSSTTASFLFSSSTISTSNGPWGVDVSDIDGDGDADIVVANRNSQLVNVFLHDGNFSMPVFLKTDIATVKPSRNILATDLDGDGKPDFAFTSFNASINSFSLDILRNKNCHQPKILNTTPLVICAGQTIRLSEIPALNVAFTWKNGGTVVPGTNSFLDITAPGNYTVTGIGESGACALASQSVSVTNDPGAPPGDPGITTNSPLCSGSSLTLSTPAVANAIYSWRGPNNYSSGQQNPVLNNVALGNAGLYTLQVSVGACSSNMKSSRVDIVDLGEISVLSTVPSNQICQGNSLVLSISSDPTYTYKWIRNGSYIGGQTTNSLTVTTTGSYQIEVVNTVVNCTRTTTAITVSVLAPPVAAFQVDGSLCANNSILFTNQSTTDVWATPVFAWNFGDTNTSTLQSPQHAYNGALAYSPSLQVSYSGVSGCSSNTSKNIIINNPVPPSIVAEKEALCPDETENLSITGAYSSIAWSTGDVGFSTFITNSGTYTVNASDANGCAVTDDITITAKIVPTISVTADKTTVATGTPVQLQASGADTYEWSPIETLSNATISNPVATPTVTTTYSVTGSLGAGCPATNQIIITVDGLSKNIVVPAGFSPNGDGANDLLIIDGIVNYPECTLSIFDGRGRKIYQATGNGDAWDGTYQGKSVPDGIYYFVFTCPEGRPVTGSVLVFR